MRRIRATIAMLACAALLGSCSATRPPAIDKTPGELQQRDPGGRLAEGIEKQTVRPEAAPSAAPKEPPLLKPGEAIWLQSGKSRVLQLDHAVQRVSIGNPDLAGIVVLGPRAIMINAKELPTSRTEAAGGTAATMLTLSRPGTITNRPLTPEPRLAETTLAIWSGGAPDVHTLVVADFLDQQVMLEITVAELNRTAMEQFGIDFRQIGSSFVSAYFMGGGGGPKVPGFATTVPPIAPVPLLPLTQTDESPTFAFQLPQEDITAFIKFLQTEGLATILAQPQLLAMSGQAAVFQVGGEIPIRIVTSFVADIEFKPFGTLVTFVPRVSEEGDIMLTVTPEVSQPDFTSPVEGIPTFRTRRASTSARLRNGETLIIGGLMQTTRRELVKGVPYLKDIPGVGYVFRDTSYQDDVTELMVIATPRLVKPLAPGTSLALPTDRGPLTNEEIRSRPTPADVTRPRVPGLP